jgi:glycerol kinase
VQAVIAEIAKAVGDGVDAVAISNQRETIVVWDARTGRPLAPAVLWQCRRSAERCAAIRDAGHGPLIEDRTGLGIDPLFPAAKLGWLIENVAEVGDAARAGRLRAGTVDTWLLWNLSGGGMHATDHSNASRTQLFNTRSLHWDDELGRIFNVPLENLPRRASIGQPLR